MARSIQSFLFSTTLLLLSCVQFGVAHNELSQDDVETISTAVLLKLLPYINAMKDNLKESLSNLIDERVSSLNETMNRISDNMEEHEEHMNNALVNLDQNMQQNFSLHLKNSFSYIHPIQPCGTGDWRRVVHLDMTDPNTNCPPGWRFINRNSKRLCERINKRTWCNSVTFPVSGGGYTRVCGKIKAYQYGPAFAFKDYDQGKVTTIDGGYVSGVSLTHGSPRQHIWTFAAGGAENRPGGLETCPCDATINITIPPFVGGDYFCESGDNLGQGPWFREDDPLWDGEDCYHGTCCSFNSPPYFTKQLPSPTTDDIEARICQYGSNVDIPIELIELYVLSAPISDILVPKLDTLKDGINSLNNFVEEHEDFILEMKYPPIHTCNGTAGWRRVVYLNMTDPSTNCPYGWQLSEYSKRTCGNKIQYYTTSSYYHTCNSATFPISGFSYSKVCGRIIAYQYRQSHGFDAYHRNLVTSIHGAYVDGVVLTHGSPRQHIWTFATGASESEGSPLNPHRYRTRVCPCDATINISIPSFVEEDYFCESGHNKYPRNGYGHFYSHDPLWDGDGCTTSSNCCTFNNPPYFAKQLSNLTTDDIEARMCRFSKLTDTAIEFIELYVK